MSDAPTQSESFEKRLAGHAANWYTERLAGVVDALRRLAVEVEREGRVREKASFDGTPRFSSSAESALHALSWGIANLNAPRLIAAAAQADKYEAEAAHIEGSES